MEDTMAGEGVVSQPLNSLLLPARAGGNGAAGL